MARPGDLHDLTRRNVQLIGELERAADKRRTLGEVVADRVAAVMGSWAFVLGQSIFVAFWVTANIAAWWGAWDPFPFALLNLIVAVQVAFATPVILMSQNRAARLEQRRAHLDLQINLLTEQQNTEQMRLLHLLCAKAGIDVAEASEPAFAEPMRPERIVEQISEHVQPACD